MKKAITLKTLSLSADLLYNLQTDIEGVHFFDIDNITSNIEKYKRFIKSLKY